MTNHTPRSIASIAILSFIGLLSTAALPAQTFSGIDSFDDNTLTVGAGQRWGFDAELQGSGTAFTEQNARLEFTSSLATGWNVRTLGWTTPSANAGSYGSDWSATVMAANHTTPASGFTYAGLDVYTLADQGGEDDIKDNAYYGIYLAHDAVAGARIVAEWGRWNEARGDFDRYPAYVPIGATTDAVLSLTWHASTQQLVVSYSLDGGATFRAARTFALGGAQAGVGAPYMNGFGLELSGVARESGMVAPGKIYFDNMSVIMAEPVESELFGSDDFDDNTLTVGADQLWKFDAPLEGAGEAFTETGQHLEFTATATSGVNTRTLGWTGPSASDGAYGRNWKARVTVSNLTTPAAGYVDAGIETYTLTDLGGGNISNSAYYGVYVTRASGGSSYVKAGWGRWDPALNSGAGGWRRWTGSVPIADSTNVVLQLNWDAATQVLTTAFSLDGGATFATPRSYSLASAEAGLGAPYANGFGIELTGAVVNAGQVTAGQVIFDNMSVSSTAAAPVVAAQPQSQSAEAGGAVALTVTTADAGAAVQWQRNGEDVAEGDGATLTLDSVEPADAGIYSAIIANGDATTTSAAAIIGVSTDEKVIGEGEQLGGDVVHPNGNIFNQVLVTGTAEAVTSDYDVNKITRTSFIDLNGDIVQVEFSGPGTLSLVLDEASGPAEPEKYTQAVDYMKGHAGIVITGADERSNLLIFTVGRATAFDPTGHYNILLPMSETNDPATNGSTLFAAQEETDYDGFADLAYVAISTTNGKFGAVRTANARYFASNGFTGIYAPGVAFQGPVFVGNIDAFDYATPVLVLGSASDVRVTGGNMQQDNERAVTVSGVTQLKFNAGSDSAGNLFPAQMNQGRFVYDGADVTDEIVVNPE